MTPGATSASVPLEHFDAFSKRYPVPVAGASSGKSVPVDRHVLSRVNAARSIGTDWHKLLAPPNHMKSLNNVLLAHWH